jgi:hypothetical protein
LPQDGTLQDLLADSARAALYAAVMLGLLAGMGLVAPSP